ncbi:HAD-IA family hydrolase [Streptomyces sp. NPDC048623]|uniref:HAD family hydrolase n=1 Tax=Streptomyces sp. NPDC048623 TaxID=3155761 RepID=UPI00344151DA
MDILSARPAALLCDVDGVVRLRDTGHAARLEEEHGIPKGRIAAAALDPELLHRVVTGEITAEGWCVEAAGRLAADLGVPGPAEQVMCAWMDPLGTVDETVVQLLAAAAESVPVVLVSNGTDRLERDLSLLGVTERLPLLVNSARIGYAKPSAEIYRAAAERAGVSFERCLLIDDTQDYVDGARRLGMPAVLYHGHESLRRALAAIPSSAGHQKVAP